jgi:hypothetical protein
MRALRDALQQTHRLRGIVMMGVITRRVRVKWNLGFSQVFVGAAITVGPRFSRALMLMGAPVVVAGQMIVIAMFVVSMLRKTFPIRMRRRVVVLGAGGLA